MTNFVVRLANGEYKRRPLGLVIPLLVIASEEKQLGLVDCDSAHGTQQNWIRSVALDYRINQSPLVVLYPKDFDCEVPLAKLVRASCLYQGLLAHWHQTGVVARHSAVVHLNDLTCNSINCLARVQDLGIPVSSNNIDHMPDFGDGEGGPGVSEQSQMCGSRVIYFYHVGQLLTQFADASYLVACPLFFLNEDRTTVYRDLVFDLVLSESLRGQFHNKELVGRTGEVQVSVLALGRNLKSFFGLDRTIQLSWQLLKFSSRTINFRNALLRVLLADTFTLSLFRVGLPFSQLLYEVLNLFDLEVAYLQSVVTIFLLTQTLPECAQVQRKRLTDRRQA